MALMISWWLKIQDVDIFFVHETDTTAGKRGSGWVDDG